jgi:hypothetical protein
MMPRTCGRHSVVLVRGAVHLEPDRGQHGCAKQGIDRVRQPRPVAWATTPCPSQPRFPAAPVRASPSGHLRRRGEERLSDRTPGRADGAGRHLVGSARRRPRTDHARHRGFILASDEDQEICLHTSECRPRQRAEKENTMLTLAIAMATVVWVMIGYALLSPNPPAPDGVDVDAHV